MCHYYNIQLILRNKPNQFGIIINTKLSWESDSPGMARLLFRVQSNGICILSLYYRGIYTRSIANF